MILVKIDEFGRSSRRVCGLHGGGACKLYARRGVSLLGQEAGRRRGTLVFILVKALGVRVSDEGPSTDTSRSVTL